MNILNLFPIPVLYEFESEYKINPKEIEFILNSNTRMPSYNDLSDGSHVLENEVMGNLKKFMQKSLDRYTKEVLRVKQDFYITQTWFTRNRPKQFHVKHYHYNSIVSGVFYLNANPQMGKIEFHNDSYGEGQNPLTKQFAFRYDYFDYNSYNSSCWWLEVKTGTLIIFPSWLSHSVTANETNEDRICIGFNSFVRGNFGNQDNYDDLTLK